MINVADQLPPWFENVLVYGTAKRLNVSPQFWQARRWTGWTSGFMQDGVDQRGIGEWLTPCDYVVRDVVYWSELPEEPTRD